MLFIYRDVGLLSFDPYVIGLVRTSMADYKKEDWLVNLPLYVVEELEGI